MFIYRVKTVYNNLLETNAKHGEEIKRLESESAYLNKKGVKETKKLDALE